MCSKMPIMNFKSGRRRSKQKKGTISKLVSDVKSLKKHAKPELKQHCANGSSTDVTNAGQVFALSLIAQGSNQFNRVGNQILAKRISLRGFALIDPVPTSSQIRVILFTDNSQDGVVPTVGDVLDVVNINSCYNRLTSLGRFGKIMDRVYVLDADGPKLRRFDVEFPQDKIVRYQGTTATQANQQKNNYYLLVISDNSATEGPFFNFESELLYSDE